MISRLNDCKIEIKNVKFTADSGVTYPKTAIVSFNRPDKTGKTVDLYGYIEQDDIFKLIEEKKAICLDHCLIDKFSLSDYRTFHGLPKKEYVNIQGFSAKNAFFSSNLKIDFSFASFASGHISFDNSFFAKGDLSFNSAHFAEGGLSFTYTIFNCDVVDFANTVFGSGDVSFKNAIFTKGTKDFQYADFGKGDVTFINTEFNDGDISFINALFGDGELSFKVARIGNGKKDFHYAKFGNGEISFERTEFGNGRVDFRKIEFGNCRVTFNRAVFGNGAITFEGSELKSGKFNFKKVISGEGGIDFSIAEFENAEIYFDDAYFGHGSMNFYNSKFQKISLKSCHLDHYIDLRLAHTEYLDLSNTIVRDILDMKPYDFPVDIKVINFEGMRLIGRIYIDWNSNNVRKSIENQVESSLRSKGDQFRTLKQNFNVTGQYTNEDDAYVYFKRYEALAELHEAVDNKKVSTVWKYPKYIFTWIVFDKIGLYAKIGRAHV